MDIAQFKIKDNIYENKNNNKMFEDNNNELKIYLYPDRKARNEFEKEP